MGPSRERAETALWDVSIAVLDKASDMSCKAWFSGIFQHLMHEVFLHFTSGSLQDPFWSSTASESGLLKGFGNAPNPEP